MSFFTEQAGVPDIHHLVKHYLDLLKERVFSDDRQVFTLTATCWRPSAADASPSSSEGKSYIHVERFADHLERLSQYSTLMKISDFRRHSRLDDLDDRENDDFYDEPDWNIDLLRRMGTPESDLDTLRAFDRRLREERVLKINRIEDFDIPANSDFTAIRDMEPFRIRIGNLPKKGQSAEYESNIRAAAIRIAKSIRIRGKLTLPVELDVQITPELASLEKDLDNVVSDIAPAIKSHLLGPSSYIHGYRVYVTPKNDHRESGGSVRVKLLPQGEIHRFEDKIEKVREAGLEWIKDEISF